MLALSEKHSKHIDLIIDSTSEVKYAGENRQRGFSRASCEVLAFFDSDDLAYPQRTQVLLDVFHADPLVLAVFHRWEWTVGGYGSRYRDFRKGPVHDGLRDTFLHGHVYDEHSNGTQGRLRFHRGWVTVRRAAAADTGVEWTANKRAQDFEYAKDLVNSGVPSERFVVLWDTLAVYLNLGVQQDETTGPRRAARIERAEAYLARHADLFV